MPGYSSPLRLMQDYAAGISLTGSQQTITHNTIYNTGRDSITVDWHIGGETFQNNTIAYNDLSVAGLLTIDGGEFYACCQLDATGTSVDHNWTHDIAVKSGIPGFAGAGIYVDNNSGHFLVHHNVSWNNQGAGLDFNGQGALSQYNLIYNNTVGGGQQVSLSYSASDATGSRIINNIFTGSADSPPDASIANNLSSSTNPQFVNTSTNDLHLQSSSPAIDAGQVISGITDGYAGTAPDEGAYEFNGANWVPGCALSLCTTPTTVDDAVQGSGQNQFNYTGSGWQHCSGPCGGTAYYDATISYDNSTNDTATIAFAGNGIRLYAGEWSASGIAAVSLDGGAETNIDLYASPSLPNQLVWSTSPNLAWGTHTLTVRVTGTKDGNSTDVFIPIDRCDIVS